MMARRPKRARSVRVADDLWAAAKDTTEARGETVTDVIVRALERYVEADTGGEVGWIKREVIDRPRSAAEIAKFGEGQPAV